MVDLDDPVVKANALAQTHPFGATAYRYVNAMIARERTTQPVEELGAWAGHALTAGYCLRRVEEDRLGRTLDRLPADLPERSPEASTAVDALDDIVRHVAALIRTEGAEPYLLADESEVVSLLDRMIGSEVNRRVGHWEDQITDENRAEIVEYLAWWVIKGYALRAVEPVLP